ncbi:MAG: thioredoxin family protein [Victivallales bacterium]|nr:thioredoxin family protein [Victivallales bacterium]
MKVQILGGGCDKCKKLLANAEEAARLNGLECDFEKVTDMETIANMGVIVTPALAFDGKVVSSGRCCPLRRFPLCLAEGLADAVAMRWRWQGRQKHNVVVKEQRKVDF